MSNLEKKLEVCHIDFFFYDEFRVADIGHICPKVKWSLASLNMLDFKMHKPQILAAT